MNKLKLTQTDLFNILVAEVESLKATKGEYSKLLGGISEHLKRLEELYKKPIPVDTEEMRAEHARIQATLSKGLYIPKRFFNIFLCFAASLVISLFFNYRQYIINEDQLEYIGQANTYIEKLEAQVPKPKTKP